MARKKSAQKASADPKTDSTTTNDGEKTYLHDHLVLLLLSIAVILTVAVGAFISIKLASGHSTDYIVQCRDCSNPSAVNRFSSGGVASILSFIVFAIISLSATIAISIRAYKVHRQLALTVLALGNLLLILAIVVSNALLMLR